MGNYELRCAVIDQLAEAEILANTLGISRDAALLAMCAGYLAMIKRQIVHPLPPIQRLTPDGGEEAIDA